MLPSVPQNLLKKPWWTFLTADQQEGLIQSHTLLADELRRKTPRFHDYAFIVFPAAKAYEGFLKNFLLALGLITQIDYSGRLFRLGKSLNPSLPPKYRNSHYVYDKLVNYCRDENLAQTLWSTWKKSRNLIFHWFPKHKNAITLPQAQDRLELVIAAIDAAFTGCRLSPRPPYRRARPPPPLNPRPK